VARRLGLSIRQAREKKGMTLRAMARAIGVTPGLVSQIERGIAMPSVGTLYNMASHLGIVLDDLFISTGALARKPQTSTPIQHDTHPRSLVDLIQRPGERDVIKLAGGVTWERLTAGPDEEVDFMIVVYEPGAESCPKDALTSHPGKGYVYALSGLLGIRLAFDEMVLRPGESITLDGQIPHRFWAIGKEPSKSLWSVIHQKAGEGPSYNPSWPRGARPLRSSK
jgi:transcriptional regulator with XRE-family HTH domain